ncbi:hypothetical protein Asfd1_84 [Aeromonas phage Asfd_1]|nr:hypothetical protein Asfd1_84 [Aeromonas phage Asfd_1]
MKFVSVIALGLLSSSAMAASFDCNHQNLNAIEKTICQVPDLSRMDEQLADAYKAVRHIVAVKSDQKEFIQKRNKMVSLNELRDLHQQRIIELQIIAELEGVEKKPHSETVADVVKKQQKVQQSQKVFKWDNSKSDVVNLVKQLKSGDKIEYKGAIGYSDYRNESGPYWMINCAYQIVRTDITPAWVSEARKYGVMKEFKSVERKFDIAFYNMTIDNLSKSPNARGMCSMINAGVH